MAFRTDFVQVRFVQFPYQLRAARVVFVNVQLMYVFYIAESLLFFTMK